MEVTIFLTPPADLRRPSLVNDVQTYAAAEFVDVWVENLVDEADGRTLVRVLVGQLNMDLPDSLPKRRVRGAVEPHVKLAHIVIHQRHLIVTHQKLHYIRLNTAARRRHLWGVFFLLLRRKGRESGWVGGEIKMRG